MQCRYLIALSRYIPLPHFARQIARAKEIKTHFLQKQAHESKDARKAAERGATGAIVSLGLVEEEGSGGGK
jgi:NADH dehydrogenase (ubiquinone) Fe-S protein 5